MPKQSLIGFERKSWKMKKFNPMFDKNFIEEGLFLKFRYNPFANIDKPIHYVGKVSDIKDKGVFLNSDMGFHAIEWPNITHIFQKKMNGRITPNKLKCDFRNLLDYMDASLDRVVYEIKGLGIKIRDKKYDTRNGYSREIIFRHKKQKISFKIDNVDSIIIDINGVGKRKQTFKMTNYKQYRKLINKVKKQFEI
jgi:hypothetical protein